MQGRASVWLKAARKGRAGWSRRRDASPLRRRGEESHQSLRTGASHSHAEAKHTHPWSGRGLRRRRRSDPPPPPHACVPSLPSSLSCRASICFRPVCAQRLRCPSLLPRPGFRTPIHPASQSVAAPDDLLDAFLFLFLILAPYPYLSPSVWVSPQDVGQVAGAALPDGH